MTEVLLFSYIGNMRQLEGTSKAVMNTAIPCEGYILKIDSRIETCFESFIDIFLEIEKYINLKEQKVEYNLSQLNDESKHQIYLAIKEQRDDCENYHFELKEIPVSIRIKLQEKFK